MPGLPSIPEYDPRAIEARWQAEWREHDDARTPAVSFSGPGRDGATRELAEERQPAPRDRQWTYIKASAPFTSGNVHMGHVRSYAIGDAYARFCRARGDAVLFAFGYDAFGLPAELGAIKYDLTPTQWVRRCAEQMTSQLDRLGFSFDWERSFLSSEPNMYRWSQWLFLTFLDAGLVYRGTGTVDWCATCNTTLATIQVEDGRCWRCHGPVLLVERPQWFLRISAYVEENDRRASELKQWDETALGSQREVLGRVEGVELDLAAARQPGPSLTVFTPYADALAEARFVLLSPRHGELSSWASEPAVLAELEEMRTGGWERAEREAQVVPVLDTGRTVSAPVGGQALPVLISPVVDSRFGPTAVLGIPERDRTDELIARRLRPGPESVAAEAAREGVRADPRESATPRPRDQEPRARPAVRYRARDFSVSRQRYWGTPIPIVYCDSCGIVPVPREQLPVVLPADLKPSGAENPLARDAAFFETQCPRCHGGARRETDTLDGHFDALWLWIPACVPAGARDESLEEILALPELRAWLPSERLVAGSDSGNFMFDQRIATKALRDIGPLAFLAEGEPFAGATMHEMVIRDGRKMSKHLGNVVEPDELVAEMGADTVRLAVLYAASPQRSLNWSESAVTHCHRFLNALWVFCQSQLAVEATELPSSVGEPPKQSTDHLRRRLSMWCETGAAKIADALAELEMHTAVRNVMRLFERIRDFQGQAVKKRGELSREDHESLLEALRLLLRWLEPLAPHIAAELLAAGFERPRSAAADLQTA